MPPPTSTVPRPASQETTVYGRAVATSAGHRKSPRERKQPTPGTGVLRNGGDMTLP